MCVLNTQAWNDIKKGHVRFIEVLLPFNNAHIYRRWWLEESCLNFDCLVLLAV